MITNAHTMDFVLLFTKENMAIKHKDTYTMRILILTTQGQTNLHVYFIDMYVYDKFVQKVSGGYLKLNCEG